MILDTHSSDNIHTTSDIKYVTLQTIGLPWESPKVDDHARGLQLAFGESVPYSDFRVES